MIRAYLRGLGTTDEETEGLAMMSGTLEDATAARLAQENQWLGIPLETAARMPRRLQEMLGYGVWRGQYGHIANRDPIEPLGRERGARMISDDARVAELRAAADGTH